MPSGSMQYTLVGFSPELDWRRLQFVKPIPSYRVCAVCGLVRKRTALLPCTHTLCDSCYEHSEENGSRVCPLDGHQCEEDDVEIKEFRATELLKRQVKCWNAEYGCVIVTAASQISKHFHHDCQHHSVCCPKCSAAILCKDVLTHRRSDCGAHAAHLSEEEHPSPEDETELLTCFRRALKEEAGEMKAILQQLLRFSSMHGDGLNEMVHGLNNHQEALRQELYQSTSSLKEAMTQVAEETREYCDSKIRESFRFSEDSHQRLNACSAGINKIHIGMNTLSDTLRTTVIHQTGKNYEMLADIATRVEEIKGGMERQRENTVDHLKKVVQRVEQQVALCVFFVKGVKSLLTTAGKQGSASYESGKVQLRGYCMTPGIHIRNEEESAKLYARLRLHKGEMDDAVQWPFEHQIRLSIMHPERGVEREITVKAKRGIRSNQRPTKSRNNWSWFSAMSINMNDLAREGYVEDDQIRVKWELLP